MEEVQRRLALKVVDLLSEHEVWIVDDTSFPKAGKHSVGVAQQLSAAAWHKTAYALSRSEQLRNKKNSWYDLAPSAQESTEGAD